VRAAAFVVVGTLGFVVQIAAVAAFTAGAGWSVAWATAAGVELAVLHNFVWHERWTWADRTEQRRGRLAARFWRFHAANGLTSLVTNVAGAWALVRWLGLGPVPANAVVVSATAAVNFLAADRWVFRRPATDNR
jgi:putative flippase GtrA